MNKKIKSLGLLGASFGMLVSLGLGPIVADAKSADVSEDSKVVFTSNSSVIGDGILIDNGLVLEGNSTFVSEGDSTVDSLVKARTLEDDDSEDEGTDTDTDKDTGKGNGKESGKDSSVVPVVGSTIASVSTSEAVSGVSGSYDEVISVVSGVDSQVSENVAKAEKTVDEVVKEKVDKIKTDLDKAGIVIKEGAGVDSNNDNERREALGKKYGITLSDSDVWENKKGQKSSNPDGTESEYTSHEEMKALGFYTVNANRQELIQYGVRTGDWYPYRAFEAESAPLYYELVEGKHEYSKIYYANQFESTNSSFNFQIADAYNSSLSSTEKEAKVKELREAQTRELTSLVAKYKAAPGVEMYVVGMNNNESTAKQWDVKEVETSWFNSKYNDPRVMAEGKFTEK